MTPNCAVVQKYRISKRIGAGSFGEIFLGVGPNAESVRFINISRFLISFLFYFGYRLRLNLNDKTQNAHSYVTNIRFIEN